MSTAEAQVLIPIAHLPSGLQVPEGAPFEWTYPCTCREQNVRTYCQCGAVRNLDLSPPPMDQFGSKLFPRRVDGLAVGMDLLARYTGRTPTPQDPVWWAKWSRNPTWKMWCFGLTSETVSKTAYCGMEDIAASLNRSRPSGENPRAPWWGRVYYVPELAEIDLADPLADRIAFAAALRFHGKEDPR